MAVVKTLYQFMSTLVFGIICTVNAHVWLFVVHVYTQITCICITFICVTLYQVLLLDRKSSEFNCACTTSTAGRTSRVLLAYVIPWINIVRLRYI